MASAQNIKRLETETLTIDKLSDLLPEKVYRHISLADSQLGVQPANTFIVGTLVMAYKQCVFRDMPKKRMVLREVIKDGSQGNQMEVNLYGDYAIDMDDLLKKSSVSSKEWFVITGAKFLKYSGFLKEDWCSISVRIISEENNCNMYFVSESASVRSVVANDQAGPSGCLALPDAKAKGKGKEKKFALLSAFAHNLKANFLVVVTAIAKPVCITANQRYHLMIGVSDLSSPKEGGIIKDSPFSLFSSNLRGEGFLKNIKVGYILLASGAKVEMYNGKLYGKIFNLSQIAYFSGDINDDIVQIKFSDGNNDDSYPTDSKKKSDSSVSEDLQEKVRALQLWASENLEICGKSKNGHQTIERKDQEDSLFIDAKISEITAAKHYCVHCQVVEKIQIETNDQLIFILRVRDGSLSKVNLRKFDVENVTDSPDHNLQYIREMGIVDVLVTQEAQMDKNINKEDYITLRNLFCHKLSTDRDSGRGIFELQMSKGSIVQKLSNRSREYKNVLARISGRSVDSDEFSESQEALVDKFKRGYELLAHMSGSRLTSSPRERQASGPCVIKPSCSTSKLPSQQDSFELAMQDLDDLSVEKTRSRSPIPECIKNIPTQGDHPHHSSAQEGRRHIQSNRSPSKNIDDADHNVIGNSLSLQESEPHFQDLTPETSLNPNIKEKSNPVTMNRRNSDESSKQNQLLITEHSDKMEYATITDLLAKEESTRTTIYKVPAMVVQIFVSSDNLCDCDEGHVCFHDWIWGICEICGNCLGSWELREKYEARDFTLDKLPCKRCHQKCDTPSTSSKKRRQESSYNDSPTTKLSSSRATVRSKGKAVADPYSACHDSPTTKLSSSRATVGSKGKAVVDPFSAYDDKNSELLATDRTFCTIVPVINISFMLRDPRYGSEVLAKLCADDAKEYFGVEPTFRWLTGKMDDHIVLLCRHILNPKQILWYGVQCYAGKDAYKIVSTALKSI